MSNTVHGAQAAGQDKDRGDLFCLLWFLCQKGSPHIGRGGDPAVGCPSLGRQQGRSWTVVVTAMASSQDSKVLDGQGKRAASDGSMC